MKFFQRSHALPEYQGGFSLIEVLIGLVLSGLLMSMVAMVLGQSITNNEVVRSSAGLSSRMFILRRILHRDLQNIVVGGGIEAEDNGFIVNTTNNMLLDGGIEVIAAWDFSSNIIRRHESSSSLGYEGDFLFLRGLKSCKIELLDGKNGAWISLHQYRGRAVGKKAEIKALRLYFIFEDGQDIMIVERIPYATQ